MAAAALLVWAFAVAVFDLRYRRISNLWLLAVFVPALAMVVWRDAGLLGQDLRSSSLGLIAAGAMFLPGYLAKACGAGDVKFAAVCGWVSGLTGSLLMMITAAGVLGLASAWIIVCRRSAGERIRLPAGPAIAIGFAVTLGVMLDRS